MAAFIALRIMVKLRKLRIGLLFLIIFTLVAALHGLSHLKLLRGDGAAADLSSESIALIISVLLVIGAAYLERLIGALRLSNEEHVKNEEAARLSEARLKETNQTLTALISYSPLAIICTDTDTNVLIWNPAAERIFGWRENEVLGKKNPIVQKEKQAEYDMLRESVRQGVPYFSKELQRQRKDGGLIYLNASSASIYNSEGDVIALLGIFEDITERRKTDVAIRESELRFRGAFENAAVGASMVDLKGRFVKVNKRLCEILGYSEEELLSKTFSDITYPEDIWKGTDALERQIRGGEDVMSFEKRYIHKAGHIVHIIISPSLIRDKDGKPSYFVGLWQDITQRRKAEDALLRSNDLLSAITNAQSKFISDVDHHFIFEELLNNLLSLTGSEYGFIGETLYAADGAPYLKTYALTNIAWDNNTRDFYEKNAPSGLEFRNLENLFGAVLKTGEPVIANTPSSDPRRGGLPGGHPPLDAFLGMPFKKGNRLVGMVGIANRPGGYDSELVNYLKPFLATCANIIEALRESASRIKSERELKQSEEQIQKSLREKETLLRELYHRTKNNMQVIMSLINLQIASVAGKNELHLLTDTQNRIMSMALVHEKLYNSRDLSNVKLKDYLDDLTNALLRSHQMDIHKVVHELEIDDLLLSIDTIIPVGLVINELMTNSLKHAFPGDRKGRIKIRARLTGNGEIEIAYSDNGTGFPKGFDFRRTESMGLKLVQNLISGQLLGRVDLRTGEESEFMIRFREPSRKQRI